MSLYTLKPRFQQRLRPTAAQLYRQGITANQVTLFACAMSILLAVVLSFFSQYPGVFFLLPLWLLLRMALNAIDGLLAREYQQQSPLGGYLNEITDVIADTALYFPLLLISPFSPFALGCFIWLAVLTEFCGVLGQIHGNQRRYDGPLGKSDRALLLGILALWYATVGYFPTWINWLMWLACLALGWTCYRRVTQGLAT